MQKQKWKKNKYGKNKLDSSHGDASNQSVGRSIGWLVGVNEHSWMAIIIWFDISKQTI